MLWVRLAGGRPTQLHASVGGVDRATTQRKHKLLQRGSQGHPIKESITCTHPFTRVRASPTTTWLSWTYFSEIEESTFSSF